MTSDLKQGFLSQVNRSNGGIPKYPVAHPIMVTALGVEGDVQSNMIVHGGPNRAVLMIAGEIIRDLAGRGFPVFPGALGENLTVAGFDPHLWRSGQRYRIGADLIIEFTKLRMPCDNLYQYGIAIGRELYDEQCRRNDVTSLHWAHGGFYARVVREGVVAAGAPVVLEWDIA